LCTYSMTDDFMENKRGTITAVGAILSCVFLGLSLGMLASGATVNLSWSQPKPIHSVSLTVIPDFSGNTYDAFVFSDGLQPAKQIHVSAGEVNFTISNLDSALNLNYNKMATNSFTFMNDTSNGMVPIHYNAGDSVNLVVSHTFTVKGIGEVPIVPGTTTSFTLDLKPGTYQYYCIVPCGPGMNMPGEMRGELVVS
jgi:heme/copper-type cytochrome/quinol oxidase subunit 2